MYQKKPIIELEREFKDAMYKELIEEYIYSPTSTRPYIMIRFYESTTKHVMKKILTYITENYDIDRVDLSLDDRTLYVNYDFWKRFPSE